MSIGEIHGQKGFCIKGIKLRVNKKVDELEKKKKAKSKQEKFFLIEKF